MPACRTRIDTQKGDLEVSPWGPDGIYRRPALKRYWSGAIRPTGRLRSFVEDLFQPRKHASQHVCIAIGPTRRSICIGVSLVAPVMSAGTM
eukprot:2288946-Amphidinium_carterae.1